MKRIILVIVLCLGLIYPACGIGFVSGYQYAFSGEEYSGHAFLFDVFASVGVYMNFFGFGVTDQGMYHEPFPGDPLAFTIERDYWAAQSYGITLRVFPGIYAYAGYCNGHYYAASENYWYDETYTLSYDGYYTTLEAEKLSKPGFDFGVSMHFIPYTGFLVGYNYSLEAVVVGFNTGIFF